MPIKLSEADRILKDAYLYLVSNRTSGKKAKLQSSRVVCNVCGRADKTLRKIANEYICNDCLKEQQQ